MDGHAVEIKLNRRKHGATGRLLVDGVDLSNTTQGFTLAMPSPDKGATLTVDLIILGEVNVSAEGAQVVVPTETREALVALGWTPPGEVR